MPNWFLWHLMVYYYFPLQTEYLRKFLLSDYGQDVLAIIRKQRFSKTFVFQSKIVYHKKLHKKTCSCVNWKSQNFFPNNPVLWPFTPNGVLTSSKIYNNEAVLTTYFSYRQMKEQTNGFKFTEYFAVDKKKTSV